MSGNTVSMLVIIGVVILWIIWPLTSAERQRKYLDKRAKREAGKGELVGHVTTKRVTGPRFFLLGPIAFFFQKREKHEVRK